MGRRLESLEDLSQGTIPALRKAQAALEEEFVHASETSENLEDKLNAFKVTIFSFLYDIEF